MFDANYLFQTPVLEPNRIFEKRNNTIKRTSEASNRL